MGYFPPPPPLSRGELERRWRAGARTLAELDPDLVAWQKQMRLPGEVAAACIAIGLVVILLATIFR